MVKQGSRDKNSKFDPVNCLLVLKYNTLSYSADFLKNPNTYRQKMLGYKDYLEALKPNQLSELLRDEQDRALFDERLFDLPSEQADSDYWSMLANWTIDEATALSLGKSPERINWKTVEGALKLSTFAAQYARRRDAAVRAVVGRELTDPVLPGVYIAWCERMNFAIPKELANKVEATLPPLSDWKTLHQSLNASFDQKQAEWAQTSRRNEETIEQLRADLRRMQSHLDASQVEKRAVGPDRVLGRRERESMLKIIIGMALVKYKYDRKSLKSPVPSAIVNDLAKVNANLNVDTLKLDVDTVRSHLQAGSQLLE